MITKHLIPGLALVLLFSGVLITPQMAGQDSRSTAGPLLDQVKTHLAERTSTWLASFAELVVVAANRGVPMGGLQAHVTGLLGPGADREVHDDAVREALIDALVGRWASITPDDPERRA